MKKAYFNWSGGKDSALALWKIKNQGNAQVDYLLTSMNGFHNRISMHGVRRELLEAQAKSLNISLTTIELPEYPSMLEYESIMAQKIEWLKRRKITHAVFGDIFLEDLRKYRETTLTAFGIECLFPLWKRDTKELVGEFMKNDFKAVTVCVNERLLDRSFVGRELDAGFFEDLPASVDPCGENGEFHSFVYAGPIFNHPIRLKKGEIVYRHYPAPGGAEPNSDVTAARNYGFYFCDFTLDK